MTSTDRITYVDAAPTIPGHLGTDAPHVHHRGSDACLRAPDGVACPTPAELRAEVERLTSVVDVLRAVRDVKAWEAESATAERDALQQQVANVQALADEWDLNDCPCDCCREGLDAIALRSALGQEPS